MKQGGKGRTCLQLGHTASLLKSQGNYGLFESTAFDKVCWKLLREEREQSGDMLGDAKEGLFVQRKQGNRLRGAQWRTETHRRIKINVS